MKLRNSEFPSAELFRGYRPKMARTEVHFQSKTYNPEDFGAPEAGRLAAKLRAFVWRLRLSGIPLGVNGVLRKRVWVRRHKLWEYVRTVGSVLETGDGNPREVSRQGSQLRVLDFGGAATLPIYYLAAQGCEVLCLDIDAGLREATNRISAKRGWRLRCSSHDLTQGTLPESERKFDAAISCSVLEHIPKKLQPAVMERLAAALRPGGVMAITFDFGADAPQPGAIRDAAEVAQLVAATGMSHVNDTGFVDTGERFVLDNHHPGKKFTFGSLFLRK